MVTTYLTRAYRSFAIHVLDVPSRLLALLLFQPLLFLPMVLPTSASTNYLLSVLVFGSLSAIFAASWDLLVGRCGQMTLGHAIFFGLGSYVTTMAWVYLGWPIWATIPLAVLITTLASLFIGFPALRVKGPYLALISMALPLIATSLIFYFKDVTGGENGLPMPISGRFFPQMNVFDLRTGEYYLTLLLVAVSGIILYKIAISRTGMVFVSILDDELASKACGINVTKYKMMAFAISAAFASLSGAVYAHILTVASPFAMGTTRSFFVVIMTVFGGMGTIAGGIVGAYLIHFIDSYVLRVIVDVPVEWHPFIFIGIVVIFILKWPRGITRFVTDGLEDLAEEREIEERGAHIWKKYKRKKKSTPEG